MNYVSHRRRPLLAKLLPAVSMAMIATSLSAQAATSTWAGTTSGLWATNTSWTGSDTPPLSTDTALFAGNAAQTASIGGTAQTIGGIVVTNTLTTIIANNSNTAGSLTIGSGGITIAAGSGTVTLENNSGATTGALTLNLGASQTWANNGANPFTVSSNITNTSSSASTLTLGGSGAGATNISGIISDGTSAKTGLTVASSNGGAVNLTNANTYTGTTTVGSGTLNLNFAGAGAPTNNIISSSSVLNMGGGSYGPSTLNVATLSSTSNSQTFASTTFNQGASTFSITNGNSSANGLVSLGAITRNEGSAVNFVSPTVNTTSSTTNGYATTGTNTNGILGGYATYNGNDWASVNGSGNIVAYTGYTVSNTPATWTTASQNISVQTAPTGSLTAGTAAAPGVTTINSLQFAQTGSATIAGGTSSLAITTNTNVSTITTTSTTGLFVGETVAASNITGGTSYITAITSATTFTVSVAPTSAVNETATVNSSQLDITSGGILVSSVVGTGTTTINAGLLAGPTGGDLIINQNNGTASTSGLVINSAIDNVGSSPTGVTKTGAGYVTLTNLANNFSGPVSVDAGTLEIDAAQTLGATYVAAGAVLTQTPTSGGTAETLTLGPLTGAGTIKVQSPGSVGQLVVNETASTSFGGQIIYDSTSSSEDGFTKNGSGTLTMNGAANAINLYRGITVDAGGLTFAGAATAGNASAVNAASRTGLTINQGATVTLDDTGTNTSSRLGGIDTALFMNGGTLSLLGAPTGNTVETISTNGSTPPTGDSTGLQMDAGADVVSATAGTGSTVLTFGGNYQRFAGSTVLFQGTNLGSTPGSGVTTVKFNTAPTLTGTAGTANYGVLAGTFVDSVSGSTNTYSIATYDSTKGIRALASAETVGALTAGDNVLLTSGVTNSAVTINSLTLGTGGSIDNTTATLTVGSGTATILSTGASTSIGSGGGSTLALGAEGVIYAAPSSTLTIAATVSASALTVGGAGEVILTGNNASTLTGTVTIDGGTLSESATGNLGATTNAVAINNGGELQSTGASVALGSGTITLGGTTANTITSADIDVSGASTNTLTQGGIITGVGSLTKSGVGVLVMNATNTYSGATQITGGALNLTSTGSTAAASTVTVGGSGMLEGSGTVNGALVTTSGATVAPGTVGTIGTLHVGSLGFTIGAGTNFDFDLGSTTTAGGTTNDEITLTGGALTIGGSGIVFNFSGASLATTGSYTLISGATSIAGFSAADFSASGTTDTATFTTVGNNLYVSFSTSTVTPVSTTYYFTGSNSSTFTDPGNFATTATGTASQTGNPLSATSNVFLDANSPSHTPPTLASTATINSLTFVTAGETLSGTGTLTVASTSTGGSGITDSAIGGTTETIAPTVTLGASQGWTVSSSTNTLAVTGAIAGSSGQTLTLNGPGKFVFSNGATGASFGGNTTLASGSLLITNTSGSALGTGTFTVARGATFGGAGSATGLAVFSIGNTGSGTTQIQVGNGTDTTSKLTLTALGASTISNANLAFNLDTTSTNANQLNLGNTTMTFSNTTLTLNMLGGQTVAADTAYLLITDAAGFQGLTVNGSNVITAGLSIATSTFFGPETNGISSGYYSGSYLVLADGGTEIEVEVVPEPGTWALMLGGLGVLFFWQRRRNAQRG